MTKRKAARKRLKPKRVARRTPTPRITQAEYARRRGVSREAVNRAVREGRISVDSDGRLDPDTADAEWTRNTTPRGVPAGPAEVSVGSQGVVVTLTEAKTKLEYAKAQLAELDLGERAGELVRVDEVRDLVFTAVRGARDKLETIPDRLAEVLVGQTDPDVIRKKLAGEIRTAIEELMNLEFGEVDPAAEARA